MIKVRTLAAARGVISSVLVHDSAEHRRCPDTQTHTMTNGMTRNRFRITIWICSHMEPK